MSQAKPQEHDKSSLPTLKLLYILKTSFQVKAISVIYKTVNQTDKQAKILHSFFY